MLPPVVKTITVPCPPERAFDLFTRDIAKWWPLDKNSVSAMSGHVARDILLDPQLGGEIHEIDHQGNQLLWGSFAAFSRPERLVINWHINRPANEATIVEVLFTKSGENTEVTLSHSGWETLGDQAETTRNGYNAGWVYVFTDCFQAACN